MFLMQGIKARVVNGRLVADQPSALPEGTQLDLTITESGAVAARVARDPMARWQLVGYRYVGREGSGCE